MNRIFLALALLAATSFGSGCASCSSCYDEMGPVFEDGKSGNEMIDGRAGSAFAPKSEEMGEPELEMDDHEETTDVYYEEE